MAAEPGRVPDGVMVLRLSPQALALAQAVLRAVKESPIEVTQLLQHTGKVPDSVENGLISTKPVPLSRHYREVQVFDPASRPDKAYYMHNKSLIEVVGEALTHRLYQSVQPLAQDVLVGYPQLYVSDNPKSSSDVLVGSTNSWSPVHQDLPLYCTSAILVLEGRKEFAVLDDDVAQSLPINVSSGMWPQPISYNGKRFTDFASFVAATGGAVITLRPGDMLLMPPRVFHVARNCAPTVSCNFSVVSMSNVPLTLMQTLMRIESNPADVMHFDKDCTRLLVDCTNALLAQAAVKSAPVFNCTKRGRLPHVRATLDAGARLMEWYCTLMCVPKGWIKGFWEVRDELLEQLRRALPRHTPGSGEPAAAAGKGGAAAEGDDDVAVVVAPARGGKMAAARPRPLSGAAATAARTPRADGESASGKRQRVQEGKEGAR